MVSLRDGPGLGVRRKSHDSTTAAATAAILKVEMIVTSHMLE
jgi:hypothetical protein